MLVHVAARKVAQNMGMHKLQNVSFYKKTEDWNEYFHLSSLMLLQQLLVLLFHTVFLLVYHPVSNNFKNVH